MKFNDSNISSYTVAGSSHCINLGAEKIKHNALNTNLRYRNSNCRKQFGIEGAITGHMQNFVVTPTFEHAY